MSLDVYLNIPGATGTGSGIFVRENGAIREITRDEWETRFPGREPIVVEQDDDRATYSANITHNLGKMASEAGIYDALWQPNEIGITHAWQLIPKLRDGLNELRDHADYYQQFNPENGWGNYAGLVDFVEKYLAACEKYPTAKVSVWS